MSPTNGCNTKVDSRAVQQEQDWMPLNTGSRGGQLSTSTAVQYYTNLVVDGWYVILLTIKLLSSRMEVM